MIDVAKFREEFDFLSNFYLVEIPYDGITYPSVEHAYQAAKSTDPSIRRRISLARSPGEAKRMGKSVSLRLDWDWFRVPLMWKLLQRKFSVPDLRDRLLATSSRYLLEGNDWHDTFWGVCNCPRHRGSGSNILGLLLMILRETLESR